MLVMCLHSSFIFFASSFIFMLQCSYPIIHKTCFSNAFLGFIQFITKLIFVCPEPKDWLNDLAKCLSFTIVEAMLTILNPKP